MLCNHPQTREGLGAAQAAQVGVARPGRLACRPSRRGRNRFAIRNNPPGPAAITLSWLLLISASVRHIENAEAIAAAAAATRMSQCRPLPQCSRLHYAADAGGRGLFGTGRQPRRVITVRGGRPTACRRRRRCRGDADRIKAEGEARNALGTLANTLGFAPSGHRAGRAAGCAGRLGFQKVDGLIVEAQARRPDFTRAAKPRSGRPRPVSIGPGPRPTDHFLGLARAGRSRRG